MTSVYDQKELRARLSSYLAKDEELQIKDFKDIDLTSAAVYERVDLLLWEGAGDIKGVDFTGIKARQKEYSLWHMRMKHTLSQVLVALNVEKIPVIVLRGLAVAEQLYCKPYMRPQSDIDLMFHSPNILQAKQILWDIGFRPDSVYSDIFVRGDIQLDLHIEPLGVERVQAWQYLTPLRAKDFFNHAEEGVLVGERALLLDEKIQLPYLCFHAMKHSFERLLWLYDIALLAKDVELKKQWDGVLESIQNYRLQRPCFYALAYVHEHLNAEVPSYVLDAIRPDMGLLERGLFARHMQHEQIPYLAERLFARMQPSFKHRMLFWKETIYPRYEVRQQMANGACVKCSFIRTRLRQMLKAIKDLMR